MSANPRLRRDAAANRERILETARRLFAEQGLDTSMDEVARAANVGSATLYRRFATKEALLDAVLGDVLAQFIAFAHAALLHEDAFAGLRRLLEQATQLQAQNRGLLDILSLRLQQAPELADARTRFRPLAEELVSRAQRQGTLRADLTADDLPVLFWELGRVVETTGAYAPELWHRYLGLMLDGLRPQAAHPLPQPSLTDDQLDEAMLGTATRRQPARPRTVP